MQTWATFSITDHRKPIYRQALALFDKIVVPIPSAPIGDLSAQELDQLEKEVAYLEEHGAAQRYPWDSREWHLWRSPLMAEALARGVSRDSYMDTRLMLRAKLAMPGVDAVPVYGDMDTYATARNEIGMATWGQVDNALTVEIAQMLPVPDHDTPLENLVRLREDPAFQHAMRKMNSWKHRQIPSILANPDHEAELRFALEDFKELSDEYTRAMEDAKFERKLKIGSVFIAPLLGDVVGAIKEGAMTYFEARTPLWKELGGRECAYGGLVYHFQEAVH